MAGFVKLDTENLEFGDVISYEVATSLKENIDLLSLVVPIGEVIPIMTNIPGVPALDSNIWQECNGSEITNLNSPLRTVGAVANYTPDLTDRYIKVPIIFGNSGLYGGLNDSYILRHNHGGQTGTFTAPDDGDPSDDQRMAARKHSHTIAYSFPDPVNLEPPFFTLKWYMRIQ